MPDTPDHNRRTFPRKLYDMLEQEPEEIVGWLKDGNSFRINDETAFCEHVLPKHYAHNKMASFQRQLNIYGFRRVIKVRMGARGVPGSYACMSNPRTHAPQSSERPRLLAHRARRAGRFSTRPSCADGLTCCIISRCFVRAMEAALFVWQRPTPATR